MYYSKFPQAPVTFISALSAALDLPTIVDARVGREDNAVFLDVFQDEDNRVTAQDLADIGLFCGVTSDEVFVEPIDKDHLSITVATTCYDFSAQWVEHDLREQLEGVNDSIADMLEGFLLTNFPIPAASVDARPPQDPLPGEEDSEETIQALEALFGIKRP